MEPSEQSQEILNLGGKFIEQLGPEQSHDVLGHWMAYYLAELMVAAEKAEGEDKAKLQKECAELILKIWKNRAAAPRSVRPLSELEPAIRLLDEIGNSGDHSWSAYLFRGKNPCHKAGATIHEAANLMMGLLLYSQTLDTNWTELDSWREKLPKLLKKEELALIEGIKALSQRVGCYYGLDKSKDDKTVINRLILEKLKKEHQRQKEAIDELEKAIQKGNQNDTPAEDDYSIADG